MSELTENLKLIKYDTDDKITPTGFNENFTKIDQSIKELRYDYVVSEGTANGWRYRRWNSGIQECWTRVEVSFETNIAWGAIYRSSLDLYNQSYPVNFSSTPTLFRSFDSTMGTSWALACSGASATKTGGTMFANPMSIKESGYLSYYAIGWWKK